MTQDLFRLLVQIVLGVVTTTLAYGGEETELLVFISAFQAGDAGGIQAFRLHLDTGELKFVHRTTEATQPFFLAISRDRRFLYTTEATGEFGGKTNEQVAAFQIVGEHGELKFLNRQSSLGTATCYVDVDATGKAVVASNYSTGSVACFPVQADGSLGHASAFVQHVGSSINPSRQEGPHAHCLAISPDNRFAYAADLGLDQVLAYRLDVAHGKLVQNSQPFIRSLPGSGPRHLAFHPLRPHVYVINELTNSITVFDRHPGSGFLVERQTISTLPKNFAGKSYCADLKITPDGRFLFGTNRGHHSIASYRIDDDGRLSPLNVVPSGGDGPQNLAITPDGGYLLCANMPRNNIAVFQIDPLEGSLKPVGHRISIPAPSCIRIR